MHGQSADALLKSIVSDIEQRIRSKNLLPGDRLPSENEISREYMASRFIVRRALRQLENLGWVDAVQGKGRFVKCRPLQISLEKRVTLPIHMEDHAEDYKSVIRKQVKQKATSTLLEAMPLPDNAMLLFIERALYFSDVPSAILRQYIPLTRFPDFPDALEAAGGSVSHALVRCGLQSYERGAAMLKTMPPDPAERELMRVPNHIPFIELRQACYDEEGLVQYMITRAPSDRVELHFMPH